MNIEKETPPVAAEGVGHSFANGQAQGSDETAKAHHAYERIPEDLRRRPQWVAATADKVPIDPRTGRAASVSDRQTWASFEEALACGQPHIGFVLTAFDPYVAIDIDDKRESPASDAELAVHARILAAFESYTERSVGARWTDAQGRERGGYHIIIKGRMPAGRDRGHVGVYSSSRFMIFTGDVVREAPVAEAQEQLDALVAQMPAMERVLGLEQVESNISDSTLHEIASGAANAEKYLQLCRGEWQVVGYPSQSEADYALLSMLALYSPDNEQVRRVFRLTALGKRDKAMRNDRYLNTSLAGIRAAQAIKPAAPSIVEVTATEDVSADTPGNGLNIELPPGLLGSLTSYFYSSALYPMHEGAILAALGLMAGIAGRAFNFRGTGLNLYLLLLAESGRGKEDMARGIERVQAAARARSYPPNALRWPGDDFMGPRKFASGQALNSVIATTPSLLSIQGEFGLRLKELNDPRASQATNELRISLLDLYAKSGRGDTFSSTAYADRDKNTLVVKSPALTILGESTPGHVFDSLSFRDIEDGLLPRTLMLQAMGDRPASNRGAYLPPGEPLVRQLMDLVTVAQTVGATLSMPIEPREVEITAAGAAALDALQDKFDHDYNDRSRDAFDRALWNRAPLNIRRIAALIAVGCMQGQGSTPIIDAPHVDWAYRFVSHCVEGLARRFRAGMVGGGESRQEAEVRKYVRDYLRMKPLERMAKYGVQQRIIYEDGVIPMGYLRRRAKQFAAFNQDRRGFNAALNSTLAAMCQTGSLIRLQAHEAHAKYGVRSEVFLLGASDWR